MTLLIPSASVEAAGPLYNTPVYNPDTKSYFELYSPRPGDAKIGSQKFGFQWQEAYDFAIKRVYKGVRGRLAIVSSEKTHEFLKHTFAPSTEAWIGLRYWCRHRKLQWVTGEIFKGGKFAAWGKRWHVNGIAPNSRNKYDCYQAGREYFPVHYWRMDYGFYWNANGAFKGLLAAFIEYPTGKK